LFHLGQLAAALRWHTARDAARGSPTRNDRLMTCGRAYVTVAGTAIEESPGWRRPKASKLAATNHPSPPDSDCGLRRAPSGRRTRGISGDGPSLGL